MRKFIRTLACASLLGAALSGPAYGMGPMVGVMGAMVGMGAMMGGMGAMTGTMGSGDSQHQEGAHQSDTRPAPATPMDGDTNDRKLSQEPDIPTQNAHKHP